MEELDNISISILPNISSGREIPFKIRIAVVDEKGLVVTSLDDT